MVVQNLICRGRTRLLQTHAVKPLGVGQRGPVLVVHDGQDILDGGGGVQRASAQVLGGQRQPSPEQVQRSDQQHEALTAAVLSARRQIGVAARRGGSVHEGGQRGAARVGQL